MVGGDWLFPLEVMGPGIEEWQDSDKYRRIPALLACTEIVHTGIGRKEDPRLKLASDLDYTYALNSTVPFPDLYSKESVYINSYNLRAMRDLSHHSAQYLPYPTFCILGILQRRKWALMKD